jgi:starch phosphorylase
MKKKAKAATICQALPLEKLPTDADSIGSSFKHYFKYHLGHFQGCDDIYLYKALSYAVRDRLMSDWANTVIAQSKPGVKKAYYMSLEFLIGRALGNNLLNLGIRSSTDESLQELAIKLEEVEDTEPDAGLGNGGLGRLAACFMDSCAHLKLPVVGYGIRYEYGMFRQLIENGYQSEEPDHWLSHGNPWEIERPHRTQRIHFGGHTEYYQDYNGETRVRWVGTQDVLAVPHDVPIPGYKNGNVNTLRLWKAAATDEFNLDEFNAGSYPESVAAKNNAEHISMVLYPNDSSENGKELRLRQQYFLASASLKDVVRIWLSEHDDFTDFANQNVFQMNDTHPTIAVAELMRILMDEHLLAWDDAWAIVNQCMAYTNHTLLPEALERWSVPLFEALLPRLLDIIYEINARFIQEITRHWPGDSERIRRMSIIEEGDVKQIRMAYLAIVGSFSVNGVAALHSDLLVQGLFKDFFELWPEKFNNKTNGVTPRRWIAHANPGMTDLISQKIEADWVNDLSHIADLKAFASLRHKKFHTAWKKVKQANKQRLADLVEKECGVTVNPEALFDIQVKRIHEYKRQLLNVLHVIHLYSRLKKGDTDNWVNRFVLIGGKAAPGYVMAKNIIKLINNVADVINNDPEIGDRLKLVFFPNYRVSTMEVIAPAADLSEQISTAGKEASGTGNMKFMMNGALTIGTYDGANIEIMENVGEENFFLFGLRDNEVEDLRTHYNPQHYIDQDQNLQDVMHLLESAHFNLCEPGIFDDIINSLKSPYDPWMTLADFTSYVDAQNRVNTAWLDQKQWQKMSILNTACSGFFSTDRTMREYNEDIWKLESL